jgi:hypothetical protein
VSRHLEAAQASTDKLARALSPLPDLPDRPDEVGLDAVNYQVKSFRRPGSTGPVTLQVLTRRCSVCGAAGQPETCITTSSWQLMCGAFDVGALSAAAGTGNWAGSRDGGRVRGTCGANPGTLDRNQALLYSCSFYTVQQRQSSTHNAGT